MGLFHRRQVIDALHFVRKTRAVDHWRHTRKLQPQRIPPRAPFLLGGRKMRALAIEAVMGRQTRLGTTAVRRRAARQRHPARRIMRRIAIPRLLADAWPRHLCSRLFNPCTEFSGSKLVFHGGPVAGRVEGNGGEVPAMASSRPMHRCGVLLGFWLKAWLGNAAVCVGKLHSQSPRSHGVCGFPLELLCPAGREGHSTPGSSPRLPENAGALNQPLRRRCTWFRQFRDAVDTVPSFPEPSTAI
jgi:hypothetical protein